MFPIEEGALSQEALNRRAAEAETPLGRPAIEGFLKQKPTTQAKLAQASANPLNEGLTTP